MQVTRNTSRRTPVAPCELGAPVSIDLHGRSFNTSRRAGKSAAAARRPRSNRTLVLAEVELKRIEDALLESLLDIHTNRDNALDRLLDDMSQVEAKQRTQVGDGLQADALSESKVERIEELLVAALMDNHPGRNRALDRILDDIEVEEERARAAFDATVDNDFDGLS